MSQESGIPAERARELRTATKFIEAHHGKASDGNAFVRAEWEVLYDDEIQTLIARGNVYPSDPKDSVTVVCTHFTPSGSNRPSASDLVSILGEKPNMGLGVFFALGSGQPRPKEAIKTTLSGYVGLRYFEFEKTYNPPGA